MKRKNLMRMSIGTLLALATALSISGCPRSFETKPTSPVEVSRPSSLKPMETCVETPVEEPVCSLEPTE